MREGWIERGCARACSSMKLQLLVRKIHYWLSLALMAPAIVIFSSGLLLQSKKFVGWIQPPERGGSEGRPAVAFDDMLRTARGIPELAVHSWDDVDRVDVRPGKGMLKIVSRNRWEAQLDASTGEVLQVAYRRSDWIESIHDGSWFSRPVKLGVFLPAAILLIVMWATGLYLFLLPLLRKRKKA